MKNLPVKKNSFLLPLKDITSEDFSLIPKNISLLSSVQALLPPEVMLPSALVIKSSLFQQFLGFKEKKENLSVASQRVKALVRQLNGAEASAKKRLLKSLQEIIFKTPFSKEMEREIVSSYKKFAGSSFKQVLTVSSFIFSDALTFAASEKKFVSIKKEADVLRAVKEAFAAYFSPDVEQESQHTGYEYASLNIALLLEKALPAEAHGLLCTFDATTHFNTVLEITSWLGKSGLKKKPGLHDTFVVSKEALEKNKQAVLSRTLGEKASKAMLTKTGMMERINVTSKERDVFSLQPSEVVLLAQTGVKIEKQHGPCRLQWEKIGKKFVVSRIEPVHLSTEYACEETYILQSKGKILAKGKAIGKKIAAGKLRIIEKTSDLQAVQFGDVLLVKEAVFGVRDGVSKSGALIVSEAKKDSAFVLEARELSRPVVLLPENTLKLFKNGKRVTVSDGVVYEGTLPFEVKKEIARTLVKTKTKIMVNIENPHNAFALRQSQADGVGIVRCEALFAHAMPIHPLAAVCYPHIKDKKAKRAIELLTRGYANKKECVVEKLTSSMATIAIAFAPAPVTFRLSDFKSSEFSTFLGGSEFKKVNPLHLFNKDATDEVTTQYREAFALQCQALKRVRDDMGLTNVIAMVPFCPTPEQGEEVIALMKHHGLERGKNGLQIHGRCEIPANFILAKEFIKIFDGLSLDTDGLEEMMSSKEPGSEMFKNKAAVRTLIHDVIQVAQKNKKNVSFSTHALDQAKEFSEFLIQQQIDSLSFSPDALLEMKQHTAQLEKTVGRTGSRTHKGFLSLIVGMGAVAATLIGMGAGCSVNMNSRLDNVKEVGEYIPPAKIREELEKNFQKQVDKMSEGKRTTVAESGFAEFIFEYPSSWKMNHGKEDISLVGATSTEYVNFSVTEKSAFTETSTTTVVMVDGKQSRWANNFPLDKKIIPYRIEVPLLGKKIFVIEGEGDEFEKIVGSLQFASGG